MFELGRDARHIETNQRSLRIPDPNQQDNGCYALDELHEQNNFIPRSKLFTFFA